MTQRQPTYLDGYFGPAVIKRGVDSVVLPKRAQYRLVGADDTTVYDDPTNKETVIDLTALAGGGASARGIALGPVLAGQYLCTASDAGDATKLRAATGANVAVAGIVVGMALKDANDGETVSYAPVGHVVKVTGFTAPSSGKPTAVVIDPTTAQPVKKDVPASADHWGGVADGSRGYITLDPNPPRPTALHPTDPRFGARFDATVDDTDAIRAAAALQATSLYGLNYAARPLKLPHGVAQTSKPIVVPSGGRVSGAGKFSTTLRNESFCGPMIYAGNNGPFPTTAAAFAGGNAAIIRKSGESNRRVLDLRAYGAGAELNGLAAFSIEMVMRFRSGWTKGYPLLSYGELTTSYPTAADQAFATLMTDSGDGTPNAFVFLLTASGGQAVALSAANAVTPYDDGAFHRIQYLWDGSSGNVDIYVDGNHVATHGGATGTLVQALHEAVVLGRGFSVGYQGAEVFDTLKYELASLRLSDVRRAPASVGVPTAKYTADANTLLLLNFDTLDGDFVVGTTRKQAGSSGTLPGYYPCQAFDFTSAGSIADATVENIALQNLYGPCLEAHSCARFQAMDVFANGKCGARLSVNCYSSRFVRVDARSMAVDVIGERSRLGFELRDSGLVDLHDCSAQGFSWGGIIENGGLSLTGKGYYLQNGWGVLCYGGGLSCSGEIAFSDETTGGAGMFGAMLLRSVDKAIVVGAALGYAESARAQITVLGQGAAGYSTIEFIGCQFTTAPGSPGYFKFLDAGNDNTRVRTINGQRSDTTIPWVDPASDPGHFFEVHPLEVSGYANSQFTSDADHAAAYGDLTTGAVNIVSGVPLTATRKWIVPLRSGRKRVVRNSTTGGQSITWISATGTGVTIANGDTVHVYCDGINWISIGAGAFTAGGDLAGTPTSQQVAALTGASGTLNVRNTITRVDRTAPGAIAADACDDVYTINTTTTTADTLLATVPLVAGQSQLINVLIVGRQGTTATRTAVLEAKAHWDGAAFTLDVANGEILKERGTSFTPKLVISGGNVLVKGTPWTSSSIDWSVWPQISGVA